MHELIDNEPKNIRQQTKSNITKHLAKTLDEKSSKKLSYNGKSKNDTELKSEPNASLSKKLVVKIRK